ncbi:MAG: carbon-nitrogen hydrolase family protein [Anaerolineae bacterium]|nr:carbon-nitrogen hydrolase family protein [Anaerolineae bacterium]
MTDIIRVSAVQFTRQIDLRHSVHKAGSYLLESNSPDFALIGGEFSINESRFNDSYPPLIDLAQSFNCNVIAPIDAISNRFPDAMAENDYASMHIFNRRGEIVGIQDQCFRTPGVNGSSKVGTNANVFEVDGVKIGLVRGLDLLYTTYIQRLREAEVLFVSTLAVDDMALQTAKVRAFENQCYIVIATFLGQLLGRELAGNTAIIAPVFHRPGIPASANVIQHITGPGLIEAELDLNYIRQLKYDYPFEERCL